MHATGTESLALCGNDATPDQIVPDDEATCWECRAIL
jgi:hypothetical protein